MLIAEKIREYCNKKGISIREFEMTCGLANGTVSTWEKKECFPTIASLIKMERGTGIKLRKWLEGYESWDV